jgi:hypothetical protein
MLVDRTPEQVVFYDAGVGTGRRKVTGNATGRGFGQKVRNAYEFIFEQYQIGDRIFLMGFSRGAATVRSLASFLDHFGILPDYLYKHKGDPPPGMIVPPRTYSRAEADDLFRTVMEQKGGPAWRRSLALPAPVPSAGLVGGRPDCAARPHPLRDWSFS